MSHDAIVVGAGPAGTVCAATLARAGRSVLLLDRARFPRDKVCGDCLNPSVWPLLDRLELRSRARALPHAVARMVSYRGIGLAPVAFPIPGEGEIVVRRRDFDHLLVARARELGVEFREASPVIEISQGWTVTTGDGARFRAPLLFGADGRNSSVARLAGRLAPLRRGRIAIQCHCPRPAWHDDEIRMLFYRGGYGGTAPIGDDALNVCLVADASRLDAVRASAERDFGIRPAWKSITPLQRARARPAAKDGLFLVGDALQVVEPFTGEGIFYAMRSGELAAHCALDGSNYDRAHAAIYRGRLWVNHLSRWAGRHPLLASQLLRGAPWIAQRLGDAVFRGAGDALFKA
jgi:geranylgeranyl reductase family protein